jgi:formate-nitrite transporter family protein
MFGWQSLKDARLATQVEGLDSKRRTAHEIFDAAIENGREELKRSSGALAFSGLIGGLTMGLTGLAVAVVRAQLPETDAARMVSLLFYPVGFIAVIIGRSQLFTENTLYPVILVLDERDHVLNTLRLWGVVFASNVIGAALFALLAIQTSAMRPDIAHALIELGKDSVGFSLGHVFWSAIVGGWLIALVAWIVTASHWTIGQLAMIWLLTFIVGAGHFAHCIASSGEILCAVSAGQVAIPSFLAWLLVATLGNIVGGVVIVSLLNYGQVKQP